jgi:sulfite exporter TauE/SafE
MNELLDMRWFWISSVMLIFFGASLFIATRQREMWLRYVSAEAAFWKRLGVPARIVDSTQRFEEGRVFIGLLWFIVISQLLLTLANGGAYLYFKS